LAEGGANVVPTGRRTELVEAAAEQIRKRGQRALALTCDVMDRGSLQQLLDQTAKEFGGVDILVNSAGRTKRTPTLQLPEDEWSEIMETNLTGTLRACQVFGKHMIERKYGRIINIASLSSFVALYEVAAYAASKAGVASLTKSLAIEWARFSVCVNAIAPGVFRTAECRAAGRYSARAGVSAAYSHAPLRQYRRTGRGGSVSGVRCCQFCYRPYTRG